MESITEYLEQVHTKVFVKKDCNLYIDMTNYEEGDTLLLKDDDKVLWVKAMVSRIEFENKMFDIVLDYPLDINADTEKSVFNKDFIQIFYNEGDLLFEASLEHVKIKEVVRYVERLMNGKEVFKDIQHLFNKIYKVYSPMSSEMDLVHMEILLSQCLRNKTNVNLPARLVDPYDPIIVNLKEVVFAEGFFQGLAFENVNKAIQVGLTGEGPDEPSIMERVLTGELTPATMKKDKR